MPFISSQGVNIYYEVEGSGKPLVLVPGFLGSTEDWRSFGYVTSLAQDYRLVLIDPRGRGRSDKPRDDASYAHLLMLADVIAVLDELGIEKAHYFGYSMGAIIGWHIPTVVRNRFLSLILGGYGYPADGGSQMNNRVVNAIIDGLQIALRRMPERPMEFFVAALEKGRSTPMTAARRSALLSLDIGALLASFHALSMVNLPCATDILPRISLPCLLFAGENDPHCATVESGARLMPQAQFFSLPGLDHNEALMRSDLVLPHVRKFLGSVAQ